MKRNILITLCASLLAVVCAFGLSRTLLAEKEQKQIKVGFVHVDDAASAYTENFILAAEAIESSFGDQVEVLHKYNIAYGSEAEAMQELVDSGCELIISTSASYGETAKSFAQQYPEVQFCQACCSNANTEPVLENYHTFMGEIYEGRYVAGVVAGLKLQQLIEDGTLDASQAKVGYVAAYANAEVISGYTAFLLGVRSVVPTAVMEVTYTDTWGNYALEKAAARSLIENGCVIISQHSDTYGPAIACEEAAQNGAVAYHVGYNHSMMDEAPSSSLISSRINWTPYITSAVEALLNGKNIEDTVAADVHGNDAGAGFDCGWVEMLELNESIAAPGTSEYMADIIEELKAGKIEVFKGDYIGVDPEDSTDICYLSVGYTENEYASAPSFHYVLKDVITIVE